MTQNQKKIKSTETDSEITEIMELEDKDVKTTIIKQLSAKYAQGFKEKHEGNE